MSSIPDALRLIRRFGFDSLEQDEVARSLAHLDAAGLIAKRDSAYSEVDELAGFMPDVDRKRFVAYLRRKCGAAGLSAEETAALLRLVPRGDAHELRDCAKAVFAAASHICIAGCVRYPLEEYPRGSMQ